MRFIISPELYQNIALSFITTKIKLLAWSIFLFCLFYFLKGKISSETPDALIWLAILILFCAIQSLIFASFIYFFQELASNKENPEWLRKFYRVIEWCEAGLFTLLIPLPSAMFVYAILITP